MPATTTSFTGPEPWTSDAELAHDPRIAALNLPPGVTINDCAAFATEFLWAATGRRYGLRHTTVRPHRWHDQCGCFFDLQSWLTGAFTGTGCVTTPIYHFKRPVLADPAPVVTIDGALFTQWALYDNRSLVRQDALGWPHVQHLTVPLGLAGTWSIEYTHGIPQPRGGTMAARSLTLEIALTYSSKPSRLRGRLAQASRTGTSLNLDDPRAWVGMLTGIPEVDLFIVGTNPKGLVSQPMITSPDTKRGAHL